MFVSYLYLILLITLSFGIAFWGFFFFLSFYMLCVFVVVENWAFAVAQKETKVNSIMLGNRYTFFMLSL